MDGIHGLQGWRELMDETEYWKNVRVSLKGLKDVERDCTGRWHSMSAHSLLLYPA